MNARAPICPEATSPRWICASLAQPAHLRREHVHLLAQALDLRVARDVSSNGTWVASAGVGWAASSKDIPYLTASFGVRSPVRSARLGVDLEVSGYRVPWTERTVQVVLDSESGEATTTQLSERHFKDWATTVGLRLSLEMPVTGGS